MDSSRTEQFWVGVFFSSALVISAVFVFLLGDYNFRNDYQIFVVFRHVGGLQSGSYAEYLGVRVGAVRNIYIRENETSGENEVVVVLSVNRKYKIPRNADIYIDFTGLIGEKYISIIGSPSQVKSFLDENEVIRGRDPMLLVTAYNKFHKSMEDFSGFMEEVNQLIGDIEFRDQIRKTTDNLALSSEHLNELFLRLNNDAGRTIDNLNSLLLRADGTLLSSQDEISAILSNLSSISERLARFLELMDMPVHEGEGSLFATNIKEITGRLNTILEETERLLKDQHWKSTVKETLKICAARLES
ncbi:MAG: MlaD family protein [Candidatus Wallbacteria bacterium]|nr:MlaD family protein [Candidatus Wallbacteria bacterium]